MDILGFLSGLGDAIDGALGDVVTWTSGGFATLFGDISGVWDTLTSFISWVWGALTSILGFLSNLWAWLRDHILLKIITFLTSLFERLRQFFKPLIDAIHRQQQQMMLIWNIYIKPIMNFIQALRRFLLIFRLLGFKWAKQLDAYLVSLENKINLAFLGTLRNLNILADWINFILNPFGPFGPAGILGGIFQAAGALWAIIWGAPSTTIGASAQAQNAIDTNYYDYPITLARMKERTAVGLLAEDRADIAAFTADWDSAGWP